MAGVLRRVIADCPSVKPRSSIVHWLLVLALLLSQQLGAVHAVGHALDAPAARHAAPQEGGDERQRHVEQACAQCIASAQLGAGLTGGAPRVADDRADDAARATPPATAIVATAFTAFRSRAPPFSA